VRAAARRAGRRTRCADARSTGGGPL